MFSVFKVNIALKQEKTPGVVFWKMMRRLLLAHWSWALMARVIAKDDPHTESDFSISIYSPESERPIHLSVF